MKARGWIATTVVAAACAATAGVLVHKSAKSADHLDSPATQADPTVDINDVYSWMDGNDLVAIMTLYPNAPKGGGDAGAAAMFSDSAQYVIHTSSGATYGTTTHNYDIICTFSGTTAPQTTECWAGNDEHVKGDASGSGLQSTDGKLKVFAGLRADPFFFNLEGFTTVVADVDNALANPDAGTIVSVDDAGCPTLANGVPAALASQLAHAADGGAPADFFASFNALAIVVSIDKSLVTSGGSIVSVWASTHK